MTLSSLRKGSGLPKHFQARQAGKLVQLGSMPSKKLRHCGQRTVAMLVVVLMLMVVMLVLVLMLIMLRHAPTTGMLCRVKHSSAAPSNMHAATRLWVARTQTP